MKHKKFEPLFVKKIIEKKVLTDDLYCPKCKRNYDGSILKTDAERRACCGVPYKTRFVYITEKIINPKISGRRQPATIRKGAKHNESKTIKP